MVSSLRGGGAERVAVSLCTYWADNGHKVVLATFSSDADDEYKPESSIQRIAMDIESVSKGILSGLFTNIDRVRKIRSLVSRLRPERIVCFNTTSSVLALIAVAWSGTPVFVAERNYPEFSASSRLWRVLRRVIYPSAEAVFVQTRQGRDWFKDNTKVTKIHVVPNAISLPLPVLEPIIDPGSLLSGDDNLILAVGKIQKQKGFEDLLYAFADSVAVDKGWVLAIVGSGNHNALAELAVRLEIEHQVLFPGRAGNIGDWYNRADIFVLSSKYEGFPNVLLEAMASGCACISINCLSGPSDIISNKINGILVEPNDHSGFVAALDLLVCDRALRQQYTEIAVETRMAFSSEKVFPMWDSLFLPPQVKSNRWGSS